MRLDDFVAKRSARAQSRAVVAAAEALMEAEAGMEGNHNATTKVDHQNNAQPSSREGESQRGQTHDQDSRVEDASHNLDAMKLELQVQARKILDQENNKRARAQGTLEAVAKSKVVLRVGVQAKNSYLQSQRMQETLRSRALPSLSHFEEAQRVWDHNLHEELLASEAEQENRFLYDSQDLLYSLETLSKQYDRLDSGWSLCPLGLRSRSVEELREFFRELTLDRPQIGVESESDRCVLPHTRLGSKLAKLASVQLVEEYLRQGCPPSLRPALYRAVLFPSAPRPSGRRPQNQSGLKQVSSGKKSSGGKGKSRATTRSSKRLPGSSSHAQLELIAHQRPETASSESSEESEEMFPVRSASDRGRLEEVSRAREMVLARLHALDTEHIRNNDSYFIFEDILRDVLPTLFRDHLAWLRVHSRVIPRDIRSLPIVPYRGLALQVAPLAFIYKDPEEIILCVRAMYARFWCQLNTVRNSPAGAPNLTLLPNLCAQFEGLIQERCSDVLQHMLTFSMHPLEVAFPWLHLAFANALPVEQLLHLWDRIIGFDSLLLLPILAAAIFDYRRPAILAARSTKEVRALLAETANLNVIALLQTFLFA